MTTRFKLGEFVIVRNNRENWLRPAVLISRAIKHKKRVFSVRFETGSEALFLTVNSDSDNMTIDSNLSKKFGPTIRSNSNLSISTKGNFRFPQFSAIDVEEKNSVM